MNEMIGASSWMSLGNPARIAPIFGQKRRDFRGIGKPRQVAYPCATKRFIEVDSSIFSIT